MSASIIFNAFGTLFTELTSEHNNIKATWIRLIPIDPNKEIKTGVSNDKIVAENPLRDTSIIIGKDYHDTIDLLICGELLMVHNATKSLTINRQRWEDLHAEYDLPRDIVPVKVSGHGIGEKVWCFRLGIFVDGLVFDAKKEAKNIISKKWKASQLCLRRYINLFNQETCIALLEYQYMEDVKEAKKREAEEQAIQEDLKIWAKETSVKNKEDNKQDNPSPKVHDEKIVPEPQARK
jgi:hypothetical protein